MFVKENINGLLARAQMARGSAQEKSLYA